MQWKLVRALRNYELAPQRPRGGGGHSADALSGEGSGTSAHGRSAGLALRRIFARRGRGKMWRRENCRFQPSSTCSRVRDVVFPKSQILVAGEAWGERSRLHLVASCRQDRRCSKSEAGDLKLQRSGPSALNVGRFRETTNRKRLGRPLRVHFGSRITSARSSLSTTRSWGLVESDACRAVEKAELVRGKLKIRCSMSPLSVSVLVPFLGRAASSGRTVESHICDGERQ